MWLDGWKRFDRFYNEIVMKSLIVNDIHFSMTPPRWRTEDYPKDILAKLDWIGQFIRKYDIGRLVLGGDLFHRATESEYGISMLANSLLKLSVPIYTILGNHDIEAGHESSYMWRPIGPLIESGLVHLLGDEGIIDGDMRITGCPFSYESHEAYGLRNRLCKIEVRISHGMILIPGFSLPKNVNWIRADNINLGEVDVLFNGHMHFYQGVYKDNATGKQVVNVGSLSRGSLAESDITRIPRVVLLYENGSFEIIDVPVRPASDVFKMKEAKEAKDQTAEISEFVDRLKEVEVSSESEYGWLKDLLNEVPDDFKDEVWNEVKMQMNAVGVVI